jgi:exosortase F-associated protein
MNKISKLVLVLLGVVLLVLVRWYETQLFYDPLLTFFKTSHTTAPLPQFEFGRLVVNIILRFMINSLISLGLIWVLFQEMQMLKFSAILYGILGVTLLGTFIFLVNTSETGQHLPLYYVRRFLIQPLFLLLLVPAFYLQRLNKTL